MLNDDIIIFKQIKPGFPRSYFFRHETGNGWVKKGQKSGVPYVRWPESILDNKILLNSVEQLSGEKFSDEPTPVETTPEEKGFREKFIAKHRATDGHFVRSKAEMLIDNWLYMAEIVHAYERKLPVEEDAYCDFYIPTGKVYIEYWGYEEDSKYLKRKETRRRQQNRSITFFPLFFLLLLTYNVNYSLTDIPNGYIR